MLIFARTAGREAEGSESGQNNGKRSPFWLARTDLQRIAEAVSFTTHAGSGAQPFTAI